MDLVIASALSLFNEILASGIVIFAASILLYNLTRNLRDRVARSSSVVLACVTVAYVCDVFISLGPGVGTFSNTLRLQWLAIAFMPAALFHLSDALLATTGLPSRGRRRRLIRVLYGFSITFLLLAAFTDLLVMPERVYPALLEQGVYISLRAGVIFPVYILYFISISLFAFYNVQRARQRCLTRATRRRMGYLQIAMLTPAIGIFPFSTLLGAGEEYSLVGFALVNISNIVMILMLMFLAYPLSFFGSTTPDRGVKSELLRFILRGPATGLLALATITVTASAARILSLPGEVFQPFAVVAVILLWQWTVHLALPMLERMLVYGGEEFEHFQQLQRLSERLLTRDDLVQLLDANLAASCDYLRVNTAFVAAQHDDDTFSLITAVGPARPDDTLFNTEIDVINGFWSQQDSHNSAHSPRTWYGYWLIPLYGVRVSARIGVMGFQARAADIDLSDDEQAMLRTFARRSARTLEDMRLQDEIFAALEGLLPQVNVTRRVAAQIEYKPGRAGSSSEPRSSETELGIDHEQFKEQVRAALRHYWGGSGLTSSRLVELRIVQQALPANDNQPPKALRAVLKDAIERQKPSGERKPYSPEWTLYLILERRFIEREKVRDVAQQLALSEPTFYRRQDEAIEAVAATLIAMERAAAAV
jgi:hypothetical protein